MKPSRRTFLKGIGAAGIAGVAGCLEGSGGGKGNQKNGSGNGGGSGSYHLGVSMKSMEQIGLFVQGQAAKWYASDNPNMKVTVTNAEFSASKQLRDATNLFNQGIDGLLLNPYDARATKQIVKKAMQNDVPVMNFDTSTLSKDIVMATMFGQYRGGKKAAAKFKELLNDKEGDGKTKVIANVFNIESTTSVKRLKGFTENVPDSVEVVDKVVSDGTPQDSTNKVLSSLRASKDVNAIYSNNVGSGLGALQALDQLGRLKKKTEQGHVMAFGIDGGPNLNKRIKNGYYDFAIDQPLHFYAPMSIELMKSYLDSGKKQNSLPKVGSTVKPGKDLTVENRTVFGIKPWKKPFWGPAPVTRYTFSGETYFPWLKARSVTVTQENAMAPYLYGTVARKYQNNK